MSTPTFKTTLDLDSTFYTQSNQSHKFKPFLGLVNKANSSVPNLRSLTLSSPLAPKLENLSISAIISSHSNQSVDKSFTSLLNSSDKSSTPNLPKNNLVSSLHNLKRLSSLNSSNSSRASMQVLTETTSNLDRFKPKDASLQSEGSSIYSQASSKNHPHLHKRNSIVSDTLDIISSSWKKKYNHMTNNIFSPCNSVMNEKYGKSERRTIGVGATASVRISHKFDLNGRGEKLFAVKYFDQKPQETPRNYLKRITSEFCIGSSLKHPNIINVIDLIQDEHGVWCQIMEYCPKGELFSAISSKTLTSFKIKSISKQLMEAVAYLHGTGVVHRDLKPENLLFDAYGVLKVTDFGSSEVIFQPWTPEVVYPCIGASGSMPYIAPEAFEPQDFDGRKADIWSCGIIILFMLTSHLPWKVARSPHDQKTNLLQQSDSNYYKFITKQQLPHAIPKSFDSPPLSLITNLLCSDPKLRLTAVEVLAHPCFI